MTTLGGFMVCHRSVPAFDTSPTWTSSPIRLSADGRTASMVSLGDWTTTQQARVAVVPWCFRTHGSARPCGVEFLIHPETDDGVLHVGFCSRPFELLSHSGDPSHESFRVLRLTSSAHVIGSHVTSVKQAGYMRGNVQRLMFVDDTVVLDA